MPASADDDVVVHGDAERTCDIDDRLGHLDIRLRWRRPSTNYEAAVELAEAR